VNHKRVWRLYKLNDLSVRKRRKAKRVNPLSLATEYSSDWGAAEDLDWLDSDPQ
jgi:putative transposase